MTPHCRMFRAFIVFSSLLGVTSVARGETAEPLNFPNAQYEPVEWANLDGWAGDDHAAAFATFLDSCRALEGKRRPSQEMMEITAALKEVCARAQAAVPLDESGARKFFEDNFRPVQLSKLGETDGFLTGYYEPIIDGSRVPTGEFTAPLYRRPPNLVASGWRKLGDSFPSKGVKVGRRVGRRKIVPYYTRAEIENGALDGWHLEICWLHSQIDVLFAQIQGSARIRLEDGSILRVNYDFYNGWPYTPVGRVLIDRGIMTKDEVSMQRIREWMEANPDQAKEIEQENKSYVFFTITNLSNEDEAVGGEGVPLVPGRSIAIDRALHVYGTPFFIQADLPIANDKAATKFRRLVVAQDTGSAIVGTARADIYFGAGDEAARIAGRIKNPGRFVMLLPRPLDPVEAGRSMPLPLARPKVDGSCGARRQHRERSDRGRASRRETFRCRRKSRRPHVAPMALAPALGPADAPSAEPFPRRNRKNGENNEPPAGVERRRARPVDRGRALGHAAAPTGKNAPSREESGKPCRQGKTPAPRGSTGCAHWRRSPGARERRRALVPLGRRLKQRVARGRDPIDARIDLHGHTQKQAHAALLRFLQRAQADGARMVLVVTGKGAARGERDPGTERGRAQAAGADVAFAAGISLIYRRI